MAIVRNEQLTPRELVEALEDLRDKVSSLGLCVPPGDGTPGIVLNHLRIAAISLDAALLCADHDKALRTRKTTPPQVRAFLYPRNGTRT